MYEGFLYVLYNKMINCTDCSAVSVYWATIPKFQPTKIFKFNLQFSHPILANMYFCPQGLAAAESIRMTYRGPGFHAVV